MNNWRFIEKKQVLSGNYVYNKIIYRKWFFVSCSFCYSHYINGTDAHVSVILYAPFKIKKIIITVSDLTAINEDFFNHYLNEIEE